MTEDIADRPPHSSSLYLSQISSAKAERNKFFDILGKQFSMINVVIHDESSSKVVELKMRRC